MKKEMVKKISAKRPLDTGRRNFIKLTGMGAAAVAMGGLSPAEARARELKIQGAKKIASVCPYCSVGCGISVYTKGSEVVYVEGDPENPLNRGTLCPKGASIHQLRDNPKRVTKPLYRAKGASEWKEVSWDWALEQIAQKVKKTRDSTFETVNDKGVTVNRTKAIAHVGSAALDNEEAYLLQKLMRGLGLVYIEHQARL